MPGERSRRYLERVAELEEQRRRAPARRRARDDDPTVPIDTRAVERQLAKRKREQEVAEERQRRQEIRERERAAKSEARMIAQHDKARRRAIEAYMSEDVSRAEAEELYDRTPEWEDSRNWNPRRRNVRARGQLRSRTNPGLSSLAAEIAKDVVKGGLASAAGQQFNEWRMQAQGRRGRRRRNPARLEPNHSDPKLRQMSERFHGRPDQILHLDEDQRKPPPAHVVLIGQEKATVYRPPRGSERGGAEWEHEAGDRGMLKRNASGRRLLVADQHGRVYLLQGSSAMKFDPDLGLVG